MKYTTLPNTNIKVSKICLGSMTWGNQNSEAEGHEQLDYALDQGINFIDTAELYPVPATAEMSGRTSKIIGTWLKKTGNRDKVVIASKIAGPGDYTAHIRTTGFSPNAIKEAINLELGRLQTDYIDLYQLHWPERDTNRFGVRDYKLDETDLAEVALRENVGLLAYSPMAFGVLSGKYIKGKAADNARLKLFPRFSRYSSEQATEAAKRYLKIAEDNNMNSAQMALAFVNQRPFVTSTIVGATNLKQLKDNIESIDVTLSDEILEQIDAVHNAIPNPAA